MATVPSASPVGSMMPVMVCTRPDLAQAVSMVNCYMHNPGKVHWQAVKWILWYVLGTVNLGLKFERCTAIGDMVSGFVD